MKRGDRETAAERRRQAILLRRQGLTFAAIGRRLGISDVAARRHVMKALKAVRHQTLEDASTTLQLELNRLDALQNAVWAKAIEGDVKCVLAVVRVMERRAKLLGLDARRPASGVAQATGAIDLAAAALSSLGPTR